MKHFTIEELTKTSTKFDNKPDEAAETNLKRLVENLLDPIREKWSKPITVNSAYRSEAVNRAVGGTGNSQHLRGEAADITAGNKEENKKLFDMIRKSNFIFDQLIDESNYTWLHISFKAGGNRGNVLHL